MSRQPTSGASGSISALLSELAEAPDKAPGDLLPELRPGDLVAGRFELVRELGRGGFGLVFEARDRELGRLVAFKAIRPVRTRALEKLAKPLKEEAEAAARLNHPNVVTLHDSGVHDGTPYLIMELLRGETLADRLRRGPLPPDEALAVALAVARGLAAAHAAGVLHRDLKPGNVFLGESGAIKLVDFGLASIMGRAALAAGTPAYMPPEQLRGEQEDARADVFAAAAVLFESLTGALPYAVTGGRSAVLDQGPPPRLPLPDPPPELVALLGSALARDRAGRPQGAAAWLEGLLAVEQAYAARAAATARAARRRRLRRLVWAAGSVALVAAGLTVVAQVRARARAEAALRQSRLLAAAAGATDPLLAALLLAELPDDPPPRALEAAQRVLHEPVPSSAVEGARGGFALALSPDGALAAAGMRDGTITVFRTDGSGTPLVLHHRGSRTNDLAFTPDGTRLVAAGHEGDLHLHRLDGRPEVALQLCGTPLTRLRLSPDGRRAAVAALDGRVRLIDLDRAAVTATVVHDAPVLDLAFTGDSLGLLTADGEGVVRLLDGRTGAPLARAATGPAALALALAPRGGGVAVGGQDGRVRLLDRTTLAPLPPPGLGGLLGPPGGAVSGLAWAPDGANLAVAQGDGTLLVMPAEGRGAPVRLRAHAGFFQVAWSPAGDRLLTYDFDGRALLWRPDGLGGPVVLEAPSLVSAAFVASGAQVVGRTREGTLRVWPVASPGERDVLTGHAGLVDTVAWSRDGTRLLTAGHDGTARIWDRASGKVLTTIRDPAGMIHSAGWDPREALVLTASNDGVARIWSADGGGLVRALPPAGAPLLFAAWSPDGGRVATAGLDGVIRVHAADGSGAPLLLRGHEAGITHVTWSGDGRTIASASQLDATVRLWPAAGGEGRVIKADRAVYRAGLSPGGDLLAVAEVDGPLRLFRTADLGELPPLQTWPERLWAPAWSPDGRRLALASGDGSYRVVSLDGREEPLAIRGHLGLVSDLAFRADGREIASASADGTVRIAAVDWPLLREKLAGATGACLTTAQRTHLLGEPEAEARRRQGACERRHGREPPAAPPAGPSAPGPRADRTVESGRRGS